MPWLKLWVDILDDPDLDALPDETCWAWTRMLAVAKRNDPQGQLPPLRRLAVILRAPAGTVERYVAELVDAGLIDIIDGVWHMHEWNRFQTKEDTTNAERQARFKARRKAPSLHSPQEERREEKRGEHFVTDTVTNSNAVTGVALPPPAPLFELEDEDPSEPPPPLSKIAEFAESLMGDVSWARWADGQARGGAPDHSIREALEETFNSGIITTRYAGRILQRLRNEGFPAPQKTTSRKMLQIKGGGGTVNQPAVVPDDELKRLEAELAKRPKLSRKDFEERNNGV